MSNGKTGSGDNNSDEFTLFSMLHDFYNRNMASVVVLVWVWAIIFITLAVYSATQFFKTEQIKAQIMFAAIFICCWQGIGLIKTFAWQTIHRNAITRQIRRLELSITESNTVKGK